MSRRTGKPSHTGPPTQRPPAAVWRAVAGLAVAAAVGLFIGVQVAGPSAAESAVAALRKQEAQRDLAQITELTTRARQTVQAVRPVAEGLTPGTAEAVTGAQLAQWKLVLDKETQWYSATVSGTTATNVARGGLRAAVGQLAAAVDLLTAAHGLPEAQRQPLVRLAIRQRDLAVAGWSVAATQLDQINVDAGNGHQHAYLDTGAEPGVMTGDGLPDGTKP